MAPVCHEDLSAAAHLHSATHHDPLNIKPDDARSVIETLKLLALPSRHQRTAAVMAGSPIDCSWIFSVCSLR